MKKNKNPLYVVKDKHVEEAQGPIDFLIKKLNLEPVIEFLNMILNMLLEQINSYPLFNAFKQFVDLLVKKLELFQKVWVF
jgi:hypothetical protein